MSPPAVAERLRTAPAHPAVRQEPPALLQLRMTVPPDRTDDVRDLFDRCPGTAHLAVLPGASVPPPGDLVLADVARQSADALVAGLRALHVDRDGGIAIEAVDTAVSASAERAEEDAPLPRFEATARSGLRA